MWDDLDTDINQSTTTQQQQQRKIWKLDRLLEEDVHIEYIRTFQQQIAQKDLISRLQAFTTRLCNTTPKNLILNKKDDIDTIEFLCEEFYECLYYTLNTIITESDYRPKSWKWFWNKQLQAQANLRQACYTRCRKTVGFEKGL